MLDQNLLFPAFFFLALLVIAVLLIVRNSEKRMTRFQEESQNQAAYQWQEAMHQMQGASAQERMEMQARLRDEGMQVSARVEALGQRLDAGAKSQEEKMLALTQSLAMHLNNNDEKMRQLNTTLQNRLTANDEKVERLRDTLYRGITEMQKENAEKLDQMRQTVDERLQQTLNKRLGESFSLVNERLEQVYKGLGEMRTLASGVGDLKKVLTNVKTRGIWGEMQLGTLISEALPPDKYEQNVAVRPNTQERVEYAIKLPGKTEEHLLYLPVDAKFPIESYTRMVEAQDAGDQKAFEAAKKEFGTLLRREAERISSKYIQPPYTTDFAVMYLPLEGLYAQALQLGDTTEKIQRDLRVVLSGPSTFYALLNSLQMGFRTLAIEQRSSEAWQLLGQAKRDLLGFGDLLEKSLMKLRQASDSIETATKRTRTIVRRLRDVEEVAPLELPEGEDEGVEN